MEPPHRRQFSELVARPDTAVPVAEAALLIACEEYPDLDVPAYLGRLDAMGRALRELVRLEAPAADRVEALNEYLFGRLCFKGNSDDYYDPRNSFLNDVLDRRIGIPITLSTVYIEVARWAGLRASGVGLPGHFIVKVADRRGDLLVDPYHGGVRLTRADCQERLDRIFGGRLKVEAGMLAACPRKQMLARMLRNLKAIYLKAEDHPRALAIAELLVYVEPATAENLRDRGLLYAALDCYARAADDLAHYLQASPKSPEAPSLTERIAELRLRAARLN
jgi:regulator of sirC expression with transglutaminase-like and TPR domain